MSISGPREEPAAAPFRSGLLQLGLAAGSTGAALTWVVATGLAAGPVDALGRYDPLHLVLAIALGAAIGGVLHGALARAGSDSLVAGVATGAGLGALGAVLGGFSGLVISRYAGLGDLGLSAVIARLITWTLTAGFLCMFLAFRWVRIHSVIPLEALLRGCGVGVAGALLMSLPGPSALWEPLGTLLIGAGVGAGAIRPVLVRSLGTIESESGGLLSHRGWIVPFHGATTLGGAIEVRSEQGCCRIAPLGTGPGRILLGALPLSGSLDLLNQDLITVGSRVFRYRRFPEAGL